MKSHRYGLDLLYVLYSTSRCAPQATPERISGAYFLFSLYQLLTTDRVRRGKYLTALGLSDSACTLPSCSTSERKNYKL